LANPKYFKIIIKYFPYFIFFRYKSYHLHAENRPVMDWPTRIKGVAGAAARGIAYLHEHCHLCIFSGNYAVFTA